MLIVYAHFNRSGHCGEVLRRVVAELDSRDKKYEVLDLYEMGFDAVFRGEGDYDENGFSTNETIREMQEKVSRENELIVIYPLWWNNVPAMLKGFFDRVLTARFAFRYSEKGFPMGLLVGKRALVLATAGGPAWYHKYLCGNRAIKVVTNDTLRFCGMETSARLIGNCRELTEEKKNKIQKQILAEMEKFVVRA